MTKVSVKKIGPCEWGIYIGNRLVDDGFATRREAVMHSYAWQETEGA